MGRSNIETQRRNGPYALCRAWLANTCGTAQLDQILLATDEIVYAWSKGEKSRENAVAEIFAEVFNAFLEAARAASERVESGEAVHGENPAQTQVGDARLSRHR